MTVLVPTLPTYLPATSPPPPPPPQDVYKEASILICHHGPCPYCTSTAHVNTRARVVRICDIDITIVRVLRG